MKIASTQSSLPLMMVCAALCCGAMLWQPSHAFLAPAPLVSAATRRPDSYSSGCADSLLLFSSKNAHHTTVNSQTSLSSRRIKKEQPRNYASILAACKNLASATLIITTILTTPIAIDQQPLHHQPSQPIQLTFSLQRTDANALTEQQLLVTDVWKEVTQQFLDTTYNGLGEEKWKQKRLEAVKRVANVGPDEQEQVYESIRTMLTALGDPYTRFLTPEQFDALTAYAKGDSAGVGVQLQLDPRSGKVIVLNTTPNGPAEKAGVLPGDTIMEVDGMETNDAPAEVVAAKCRGPAGTNLNIAIQHADSNQVIPLSMTRASIQVNPVKSGTTTINGKKLGIIQIASFSQETSKQVVEALRQLQQKDSVKGIVLDVRGNAGGYMPAGVDVAKLFLPPKARIITQVDKSDRKTIEIADGIGSETQLPVYILVDKRTASASEILTAALQDNDRATVIGASKTFGKGRIQNVQQVGNGSGIAVTKAKYITPKGTDIHGVGITPDKKSDACGPDKTASDCLSSVL